MTFPLILIKISFMKIKFLKKCISLLVALSLPLGAFGCGAADDDAKSYDQVTQDTVRYRIAVCRSYESPVYEQIVDGFADALYDTFGEAHIILNDRTIAFDENGEAVVLNMLSDDNELVFSVGSQALSAAAAATTTTPIVGAGVINYQNALHLFSDGDSRDRLTGRNVTGISAAPYMPDQLSLLIEATPDLRTVGILYSPIDDNAIYQNEMLETYLDQAGIPWKEYEIAETEAASADDALDTYEEMPSVILPSTIVAASGKAGSDINVEAIGEDGSLTGINSPSSTRTAKTSKTWIAGKRALIAMEEQEAAAAASNDEADSANGGESADAASLSDEPDDIDGADNAASSVDVGSGDAGGADAAISELPEYEPADLSDAAPEDIVAYACEECSALYISAESMLSDQIDMITQIATENGVSTIGGDPMLGEKTLACIFSDPYDQGYRAGKVAYRILVGEEDASTIKIGQPKDEDLQKLYQDSVAKRLGLSFPKSFSDINEFLETYVPGTYTKRVKNEE